VGTKCGWVSWSLRFLEHRNVDIRARGEDEASVVEHSGSKVPHNRFGLDRGDSEAFRQISNVQGV
jgi:hypothetical protein